MHFSSWKTERRANTMKPASSPYKPSAKALESVNGLQNAFGERLWHWSKFTATVYYDF